MIKIKNKVKTDIVPIQHTKHTKTKHTKHTDIAKVYLVMCCLLMSCVFFILDVSVVKVGGRLDNLAQSYSDLAVQVKDSDTKIKESSDKTLNEINSINHIMQENRLDKLDRYDD